jgi:SAM-dependent methyltransferase
VGKEGSHHHQKLAIPAVTSLLGNVQSGTRVLDVGCGQGVLAPHLTKLGCTYVGVDASKSLVQLAQARHEKLGIFLQADARKLRYITQKHEALHEPFDVAIFLLSIQDMDPLSDVFASVQALLKPHATMILLMMHPCFRIPRQSGWEWDVGRKLFFRRVDRYLTSMAVPMKAFSGKQHGVSTSFHRPLGVYMQALAAHGFAITHLEEIPTYKHENTNSQEAKAMNMAHQEIPVFLGVRAERTAAKQSG